MYNSFDLLLKRKLKVIMSEGVVKDRSVTASYVGAMWKNIQNLGFTFSDNLVELLFTQEVDDLVLFYQRLVYNLKSFVGADKVYTPMYPNFPKQVMEADETELFLNAIIHYLSDGRLMPVYEKEERFPLIADNALKIIDVGTQEELMSIFTNLLGARTSLSEQDKMDLAYFVKNTDYSKYLPSDIPMKENKAIFGKILVENAKELDASVVKDLYKTPTDVLRLVVALSNGDVSLGDNHIKIRKLKRKERRFIMDLLLSCKSLLEDMFRYRSLWIIVAEIIHPGEFSDVYKPVKKAFQKLRNNDKPVFFAGKVDLCLRAKDVEGSTALLATRPGEFARKLDEILRMDATKTDLVLQAFEKIADKVSSPVLWQVLEHFKYRSQGVKKRVFFPKGNTSKAYVTDGDLDSIDESVCQNVVRICRSALETQYAQRTDLGCVYVDQEFKNYVVPFSQRSASTAFKMLTRGSRIPLNKNAKVIRPFIWWTNAKSGERVDIDLSALICDENWKALGHVSYTNLHEKKMNCVHSGDRVDGGRFGGRGVSEFIDISIGDVLKYGGRYVILQVYSYTMIPYSKLPCSFGWMERKSPQSGEIYEPSTVEQAMALTANATAAMPVILDCKERVMIWADMAVTERWNIGGNNLESNRANIVTSAYAIMTMHRPSLYDLILANVKGRGKLVLDRKDADIIFSNNPEKPVIYVIEINDDGEEVVKQVEKDVKIVSSFDLDYYMGELL